MVTTFWMTLRERNIITKQWENSGADDPLLSLPNKPTSSPHTPKIKVLAKKVLSPTTLRNQKRYTMKVKRKIQRQRLIAQVSRNPDNYTTDNSESEMIIPGEEANTTVRETASTPAAFKKLYTEGNANSEEFWHQMHLEIYHCLSCIRKNLVFIMI